MTNEEAIEYNKNLREYMRITDKESEYKFLKENYEAFDMGIKALEQEPCEDYISRAEAIKAIRNYNVTIEVSRAVGKSQLVDIVDSINKVQEKMISELPSIQPKPKTGHWIDEGFYADNSSARCYRCSECENHIIEYNTDNDLFCKWCGAKMESEG